VKPLNRWRFWKTGRFHTFALKKKKSLFLFIFSLLFLPEPIQTEHSFPALETDRAAPLLPQPRAALLSATPLAPFSSPPPPVSFLNRSSSTQFSQSQFFFG
jgi:hypothetical protein